MYKPYLLFHYAVSQNDQIPAQLPENRQDGGYRRINLPKDAKSKLFFLSDGGNIVMYGLPLKKILYHCVLSDE